MSSNHCVEEVSRRAPTWRCHDRHCRERPRVECRLRAPRRKDRSERLVGKPFGDEWSDGPVADDAELALSGADQSEHVVGVVGVEQRDGHVGVSTSELTDEWCQRRGGERRETGEFEVAACDLADGVDSGARDGHVTHGESSWFAQCDAGVGQAHRAAEPVEQSRAELIFEAAHGLGDGGLGDAERVRRSGEGPVVDDGKEDLEPPEIHKQILIEVIDMASLTSSMTAGSVGAMEFRDGRFGALGTEPGRPRWVRDHRSAWGFALATVCIGAFMGQLDASIVTVAIPTIQRSFGVPIGAAAWVGLAYLVALVSTVAAFGRFADLHGRKLTYLYGFAVFVAGSALCAAAPSLDVLVACRVLQGVGAAMLQANSVAIIALAVPREKLGRAIGVQGAAQALGLAAGPSIGGLLLAVGGWRLLFLVNVPAGVVAFCLGWYLLPRSTDLHEGGHFDRLGVALLLPAVGAALCALSLGGSHALGLVAVVALAVAGVGLAIGFVRHERRATSPLVDLALLRASSLAPRLASAASSYVVLFGAMLAVPFLLERGLHVDVVEAGVTLAAMPIAIGIAAPLAGRAYERWGARPLTTSGMSICALALLGAARFHGSARVVAMELAGLGVGLGLFTPANNASVMAAVPRRHAGEASGLLNMSRGLGTGVGLALTSLVFSLSTTTDRGYVDALVLLAVVAAGTGLVAARWETSAIAPLPGVVLAGAVRRRSRSRAVHECEAAVHPARRRRRAS
jgi:EmrB/QacA subfamily drug resistance transporter